MADPSRRRPVRGLAPVYATLFSGLYVAMLLVLFALFFRPAGFDYRSKLEDPTWRNAWDWGLFVGGTVPPILLGVLVGNLVQGLPFHFDEDLRPFYEGSFLRLLNPYALACGVVALLICLFHGAIYLKWRTEGELYRRAQALVEVLGPVLLGAVALVAAWTVLAMKLPEITAMAVPARRPTRSTKPSPCPAAGPAGSSHSPGYWSRRYWASVDCSWPGVRRWGMPP